MTRITTRRLCAGLAAVGSVAGIAVSATPSGATLVCPPGTTNPNYCTDVVPVGVTNKASPVMSTGATLNATVGPGVAGGDVTSYVFQWGESTTYGQSTPLGTVGDCGGAPRCTGVPPAEPVSNDIGGLIPCQVYHFRVIASNPDGTTYGNDRSFVTRYVKAIKKVKSPKRVKHHHRFKVRITLRTGAFIRIEFRRHHHTVKTVRRGYHHKGTFTTKVRAPRRTGKYYLRVVATYSCGHRHWDNKLRVY